MTHRYRNERRLIEHLICLEAMKLVVVYGVEDQENGRTIDVISRLETSISSAIPNGVSSKADSINRRVKSVTHDVMMKPFVDGGEMVSKFGLAVYYLIINLMDQGIFILEDDSEEMEAIDFILASLSEYTTKEFVKFDRSAFRAGRRMLDRLNAAGYYKGAKWVIDFSEVADAS